MQFSLKQLDFIMGCIERQALNFNEEQLSMAEELYDIVDKFHKDMRKHYKK